MGWKSTLAAIGALAMSGLMSGLAGASAEPLYSFDTTPSKLPKSVVPSHYAINLKPNLQTLTTEGHESMDVEVREAVWRVVLNAVDMDIGEAVIDDGAQRADVSFDPRAETATLTFANALTPGAHKLHLAFTSKINSFGRGLFFVDYPTEDGVKRMIST